MAALDISRPARRYDATRLPRSHACASSWEWQSTAGQNKAADDHISSGCHPSKDKELWLCDKCSTIEKLLPVQGSLLRSSQSSKPSLLEA